MVEMPKNQNPGLKKPKIGGGKKKDAIKALLPKKKKGTGKKAGMLADSVRRKRGM